MTELLVLGVGPTISPLPPGFVEHFKKLGIAVEIMNTVSTPFVRTDKSGDT